MPTRNADIARIFDEMADLLEIADANPFRVRAYRTAAETVQALGQNLEAMVARGEDLSRLPGIGKDLAEKIREIVETGSCRALEELHQDVPASLIEILRLPALGPKRVKTVFQTLHVSDLDGLERAARAGQVSALPGFGKKTEQGILDAIAARHRAERRFPLALAAKQADALTHHLRHAPGIVDVVIAGSYRRGRETVGDLDLLATARTPEPVMSHFVAYPRVSEVRSQGGTRSTVILDNGLQVDLRVVPQDSFGAALHYFTGSKAHNIRIRRLGQQAGLKINEYGVFDGDRLVAGKTEQSVFRAVGLPYIAPELREDNGEIAAAREHRLPKLLQREDLVGDLHCHTRASDGRAGITEMAEAAKRYGLEYLAITDHSSELKSFKSLDVPGLRCQLEEIDRLNETLEGITLLKGIEVDILEDGSLNLPDEVLSELDLVIAAMHTHLDLPRRQQTERILRAMDHRFFSILAHPSARLLFKRAASELDMNRVIEAARERGCFLELNAQPQRLDLNDVYCRMAKDAGVMICVNSDAHEGDGFAHLDQGASQARRGWLEKKDVVNTRSLAQLKRLLKRTMG